MFEEGISVSQMRYDYSSATLDQLRDQVFLPAGLEAAVLSRRVDFLAGRLCARRALQAAGFGGDAEIATGEHGAPIWPPHFRGSISHCDGFAVAAVGHMQRIAALGIDIERLMSVAVADDIRGQLASSEELAIGNHAGMSPEAWSTVLFSGKESLFKALYPSVGRYFDFLDASAVRLDARSENFTLILRASLSPRHPRGSTYPIHFHWNEDRVLTHCILPAAGHANSESGIEERSTSKMPA